MVALPCKHFGLVMNFKCRQVGHSVNRLHRLSEPRVPKPHVTCNTVQNQSILRLNGNTEYIQTLLIWIKVYIQVQMLLKRFAVQS